MNEREIPNYWPGRCFVCSRINTQGLHLRFWLSEDVCFTRCTIPDYLCGLDGLVHGGIIATLLDEVSAWTIIARLARLGMTRETSVRYFKPVPTNTELVVEGEIVNRRERGVDVRSAIRSSDGALLAEADSNWILPSLSTIAKITGAEESALREFVAHYCGMEEQ